MELDTFIKIGLPISLALIMLSMGLTLKLPDFKQVAKHPNAFIVGLTAQIMLVPLLALVLLQFFNLPPVLAVGLLVLSFSPGGTTSNLFSYLARGDVALSIALTTAASFITPFSIPLLTEVALQSHLGEDTEVIIPVALTMKRLLVVSLLPVILGMTLRYFKPCWADKVQPFIHKISITLFLAVIFSMIYNLWDNIPEFLGQVAAVSSVMIIIAMTAGYYIARMARLKTQQTKTITIEVGMQNGGMALIVTQSVLNNQQMSMVPIIYGLIMLIPVIIFVLIKRHETTSTI